MTPGSESLSTVKTSRSTLNGASRACCMMTSNSEKEKMGMKPLRANRLASSYAKKAKADMQWSPVAAGLA